MDRHYDFCKCGNLKKKEAKVCSSCYVPYIRTPEHKKQMSDRNKGIQHRGVGWHHSSLTREKMKNVWTPEKKELARIRGLKNALNPDWRLECGSPAEKNPMWENGRSQLPYSRGWAKKIKQLAWERANFRCEICQSDKPCDTHHKDFRKDNHNLENLQLLCRSCHKKLHYDHLRQNKNRQD